MKRIRKSLAIMLVGIMLFSATAYADEEVKMPVITEVQSDGDEGVMPLFTYIDMITVALIIDETGRCTFSGTVTALDYRIKLELYLQRSWNQIVWDDIMGAITTVDESGGMEYHKNLEPEGYYYRAKVIVSVLDGNGNTIEAETVYSSTERY